MPLPIQKIKEFNKNVLTLATGTSIAQIIPLLVAPILTRLYSPTEFGLLALFMAISSFLAIASTGGYEYAVTLPESEVDANAIIVLTLLSSLLVAAITLLVMIFSRGFIASILGNSSIEPWLLAVPFSVLLLATFSTLNFWHNRQKQYKTMGIGRITLTGTTSLSQILFGLNKFGNGSMIVGAILGQLCATTLLARNYLMFSSAKWQDRWQYERVRKVAIDYIRHPTQLLPADLIGSAAMHLPIFIIASAHSPAAVGLYSLAYRLVSLPTTLVAEAIGQVYRQQASEEFRAGQGFNHLFVYTLFRTAAIASLPALFLFFYASDLIRIVFGDEWSAAGDITKIIVISSFFQFVITPIDNGALIVGATKYIFFWQLTRLILLITLAIYSAFADITLNMTIWGITSVSILMYLVDALVQYRMSFRQSRY